MGLRNDCFSILILREGQLLVIFPRVAVVDLFYTIQVVNISNSVVKDLRREVVVLIVQQQQLTFKSILHYPVHLTLRLNLDLRNTSGASALWLALQQLDSSCIDHEDPTEHAHTFAARLIERGSSTDAVDTHTGNSLLHRAAKEKNEAAAIFLVHHGAVPNHKNALGETPIHIAAQNGLHMLVKVLLQNGADVHARDKG